MIDANKARLLWHELHEFMGTEDQQKAFFSAWLSRVELMLGCASCFKKVRQFVSYWPVDYGEGFHFWGICLHDSVNKDLGRSLFYPEITVAPLTRRGILQ